MFLLNNGKCRTSLYSSSFFMRTAIINQAVPHCFVGAEIFLQCRGGIVNVISLCAVSSYAVTCLEHGKYVCMFT